MRSFVFSVKRRENTYFDTFKSRTHRFSIKRFLHTYGVHLVFFIIFVAFIIVGSCYEKNASVDFLHGLDFLFVTDMSSRLDLSAFSVFCSSLASNFIFIFVVFLLGFSAWGIFAIPFVCALRGFGVGLSSAYLFSQYSVAGIGFYILAILPGTVLFLFAFIKALKETLYVSFMLFKFYATFRTDFVSRKLVATYLYRYSLVMIFVAMSSLTDMLLWVLFINMFNF